MNNIYKYIKLGLLSMVFNFTLNANDNNAPYNFDNTNDYLLDTLKTNHNYYANDFIYFNIDSCFKHDHDFENNAYQYILYCEDAIILMSLYEKKIDLSTIVDELIANEYIEIDNRIDTVIKLKEYKFKGIKCILDVADAKANVTHFVCKMNDNYTFMIRFLGILDDDNKFSDSYNKMIESINKSLIMFE